MRLFEAFTLYLLVYDRVECNIGHITYLQYTSNLVTGITNLSLLPVSYFVAFFLKNYIVHVYKYSCPVLKKLLSMIYKYN